MFTTVFRWRALALLLVRVQSQVRNKRNAGRMSACVRAWGRKARHECQSRARMLWQKRGFVSVPVRIGFGSGGALQAWWSGGGAAAIQTVGTEAILDGILTSNAGESMCGAFCQVPRDGLKVTRKCTPRHTSAATLPRLVTESQRVGQK